MKTIKLFISALFAVTVSLNSFAQCHDHSSMNNEKTETFKVSGNCDMCKTTIEKAAKINGVSKADWSRETKVLTLVYNPSVVKSDSVLHSIAMGGYDTEKFKAEEKAYNALPACCKYKRSN